MNNLTDYIAVYRNVVPPQLCNNIIADYKDQEFNTAETSGGLHQDIRKCSTIKIVPGELDDAMYQCAASVIQRYADEHSARETMSITMDTGYDLLRYQVGDFYTQHTDSFTERQRQVTCSFMLNDDYEGGEFCFFDRSIVHRLNKGDAVMFPSNFMFPHEILPVTKGTRYSVITWYV